MPESVSSILLIQQALTPVFLIVGIGTLLNSLTARLARIVDRVRWFDLPEAENSQHMRETELRFLAKRMRWANWAINFLCGATVVVCINIFLLVINGYYVIDLDRWIVSSFASTLVLLSCGLVCLFVEVSLATASLRVSTMIVKPKNSK